MLNNIPTNILIHWANIFICGLIMYCTTNVHCTYMYINYNSTNTSIKIITNPGTILKNLVMIIKCDDDLSLYYQSADSGQSRAVSPPPPEYKSF